MRQCPHCNREFDDDIDYHRFGAHLGACSQNPKAILARQNNALRRRTKIQFVMNCLKCGQEFTIETTPRSLETGRYTKHCSRKCANGHAHSDSWKQKISVAITGKQQYRTKLSPVVLRKCERCDVQFETRRNGHRRFCNEHTNSRIKKREEVIDVTCPCGIIFSCERHKIRKYHTTECSHHFRSKAIKDAYARGSKSVAGGTTKWLNYKDIRVQGTYEQRTCYILDEWKTNGKIVDWQYGKARIKYSWDDGTLHSYTPDFTLYFHDHIVYLEVKGWLKHKDELKWNAMREQCLELIVWFEQDIIKEEQEILERDIVSRKEQCAVNAPW